ncbi:ATP phosphoribosyltransferase regulatory subunit [Allopseudospirillum japonicum]|uniref:ATP phosphoribosyltransferase regulatory subunit n=1 Tax=Allopseudospirillum japonicum TaxID=64971 RepID=A0A1H6QRG1_9GAMM|nr:ATP phosphoribosyltransferase regulatory subunit [Allopseudospirillum japonicum]SEI41562.1 ATP phosphoribosyltransferase regulatory subunit [Allopseudospirillum japonicum]
MTIADRWLLPDGMEELLPPRAYTLEALRRKLLDLLAAWGYDLVIPPSAEYLESLLTGVGKDLDLQTFKVTDQSSGRLMGVSADVTPQVARIDAHSLSCEGEGIARLCYCHPVLRTRADNPLSSRSPIQLGAELFGHAGLPSDLEILSLMLATLEAAELDQIHLDLGHVNIYRTLINQAQIDEQEAEAIFAALQDKRFADLDTLLQAYVECAQVRAHLTALAHLHGDMRVLEQAKRDLQGAPESVQAALVQLEQIAHWIQASYPQVTLYFDLAELRGFNYHTGIMFAAYVPQWGQAIAKGGRYDETGKVFGRARPATGFSVDLKLLVALQELQHPQTHQRKHLGVLAPVQAYTDAQLMHKIRALRAQGERVWVDLAGEGTKAHPACDRQWVQNAQGEWVISPL